MARPSFSTSRKQGGMGRTAPNQDGVTGFIMNGVAVAGKAQLQTIYPLASAADAVNLGLDAAYDTANNVLVFHHIDRFFKRNPTGKLYIYLVAQTVTYTQMLDKDFATPANTVLPLARYNNGEIRLIGAIRNPAVGYTGTITNGIDDDVTNGITKAQALIDDLAANGCYIDVALEARGLSGTIAALKDMRTMAAPGVSVVALQDGAVAARHALQNTYGAIGDYLGIVSSIPVSANAGELIDENNLQVASTGLFLTATIKNVALASYSKTELDLLCDKGYVCADYTFGTAGYYINDTPTATVATSDYAYLENNRTINKMQRLARARLISLTKSRFLVDPQSGKVLPQKAKDVESNAVGALQVMVDDGDLSGVAAFFNPDQDIIGTGNVNIEISGVPTPIGRNITVSIGFKNPRK